MDKTKKYTIIFIIICFIGIGVGGFFNQTPSLASPTKSLEETNKQEESVSIQDNQDEKKQSEEKKAETKDNKTESTKQSKEKSVSTSKQEKSNKQESTTSSTSNQSQQSTTTTESKQESYGTKPSEEVVQETPQSHVYMSIQDMNGIIASETMTLNDGDTVYRVLKTLCKQKGISMSTKNEAIEKIIYVKEINGLSEFDYGNMSGWKYKVNGVYPNVGAGAYTLKDGDRVEWVYTTEG